MVTQQRNVENVTGVSNVTYNLLSVLNNKLEGISAMEQYKQDAQGDQDVVQCFEELQQRDRTDVERLRELLASRISN